MSVRTEESIVGQGARCALRTAALLRRRQLHVRHERVGTNVRLHDGRHFFVFRETSRDTADAAAPVTLVVWFRLWAIPPGARVRRWLFERACILNTLLFAGFDGYLVKLWMVEPATSGYAGLYSWRSVAEAEHYARYITSVLKPLSVKGSVGFDIVAEETLDEYLDCPSAAV